MYDFLQIILESEIYTTFTQSNETTASERGIIGERLALAVPRAWKKKATCRKIQLVLGHSARLLCYEIPSMHLHPHTCRHTVTSFRSLSSAKCNEPRANPTPTSQRISYE